MEDDYPALCRARCGIHYIVKQTGDHLDQTPAAALQNLASDACQVSCAPSFQRTYLAAYFIAWKRRDGFAIGVS
eukprot:2858303-Pyramimonas_sp.AAC.1